MKIYFRAGKVVAEAQSMSDIQKLMGIGGGPIATKVKHKKHQFKKICPHCNKTFRGSRGLSKHIASAHVPVKIPV